MLGNFLVPLVMFGWIPLVLAIFAGLSPRRAVIVAYLVAWLFLPVAVFKITGIPPYTKMSATGCGVLLAAIIFDSERMSSLAFFPSLVDVPMVIWCLVPFATAAANAPELTAHDGFSWSFTQVIECALPYLIGRIYFNDARGMRELAIGLFVGGLVYLPLCLFEIKMSPQLHRIVYGFVPFDFAQEVRANGFRPTVFMSHGLAVGMFMTSASLAGLWLWYSGSLKRLLTVPMSLLVAILWVTTIWCRSTGATLLLLAGAACMLFTHWTRSYALLFAMMLLPAGYVVSRVVIGWNGEGVKPISTVIAGPARAESLDYRFRNEKMIIGRATERPWFGWGGYGRSFSLSVKSGGQCKWTPDSLWIITFGSWGSVGLIALLAFMLPIPFLLMRLPPAAWSHPDFVGVAVFAILLLLYSFDNLVNSMPNPVFLLGLGGLCGMLKASTTRDLQLSVAPAVGPFVTSVRGAVSTPPHLRGI